MINSRIGKYRITRWIGKGGMASVWEAEHEMLENKVAIKVLNPILSDNSQIIERFKNEAKLMASLNHPNITKVIDFDEQPHRLSIIMEYLVGEDLSVKIKRDGALSEHLTDKLFKQILSALQYAHKNGIVHRDIKPSNIFILEDGHVKILDFGIAKLLGQNNEMTHTGTQMGTPIYRSPEQVKADKTIDHRSDIYSLGVTLYYATMGKPPYGQNKETQFEIDNKIVYSPLPNVNFQNKFGKIIAKACEKDRNDRFQSCDEWLNFDSNDDLNPKEGDTDQTGIIGNTSQDATKIETPKPVVFLVIAAVFLIALVLYLNTSTSKSSSSHEEGAYSDSAKSESYPAVSDSSVQPTDYRDAASTAGASAAEEELGPDVRIDENNESQGAY